MSSIVRMIKKGDESRVLEMMRTFYASPAVLTRGSDDIFKRDIESCLSDNPYIEGYVFEEGEAIQGYAMVAKSFSTEFGKRCIWIEDLFVKEEYRGRGIGNMFLDFITNKYEGCLFRLEAEEENDGALRLYKKYGFEVFPYLELKR